MVNIDDLIARLRAEALQHEEEHETRPVTRAWLGSEVSGARQALLDALAFARGLPLGAMLALDEETFIELTYRVLLGRRPDAQGQQHYLSRLRQGTTRLEVLQELVHSPERQGFARIGGHWLWLRPLGWCLALARRPWPRHGLRLILRQLERRLSARAQKGSFGLIWKLAEAQEQAEESQNTARQRLDHQMQTLLAKMTALTAERTRLDRSVTHLQARLAAWDPARRLPSPAATAEAVTDQDITDGSLPAALAAYYLAFEAVFRGSPETVKAQLAEDYQGFIEALGQAQATGLCIDLGCGRGEWLELMSEWGFRTLGVDLNPVMADAARARGHQVVVRDAVDYLRDLDPDSVLVVSAFHLLEHLPIEVLYPLLAQVARVLQPGGLLLVETPNPENLWVSTHTFYHDPTHRNPLTPTSLEFLLNHHGLATVKVSRLHPYPPESRLEGTDAATERLNGMTCGPQDFAIVVRKTPVTVEAASENHPPPAFYKGGSKKGA